MNREYNENMNKILIDGLKIYLESHLNEKDKKVYKAVESSVNFLESTTKLTPEESREYQDIIIKIVGIDVIQRVFNNITTGSIR